MPIAQERLIHLIDCADALGGRLKALTQHVERQKGVILETEGGTSNPNLLYNLLRDLHDRVLSAAALPEDIVETVAVEKTHFAKSRHKNDLGREAVKLWRSKRSSFTTLERPRYGRDRDGDDPIAVIPKSASRIEIPLEVIDAISDAFDENPNENSMISQAQLEEVLSDVTSITDVEIMAGMVYRLIDSKIIQHAYRPGPQGIWIRGAKIEETSTPVRYESGMWLPV